MIIGLKNPTRDEVHAKVVELRDIFFKNTQEGKKSMLFSYYGGAGAALNMPGQVIVLNGTDKHVAYPLEERLDLLCAMNEKTCAFNIYDCSRVPLSPGLMLGENKAAEDEEWEKMKAELEGTKKNYLAYRAAAPNDQMALSSQVAKGFFDHIKAICQ